MPSLGADMEAGTLVEWRVAPGDTVRRGNIVAVVDTEKAVIEVEIFEDGVVEEILVAPGVKVPVGTPLARIGTGAAAVAPRAPAAPAEPIAAAAASTPEPKPTPAPSSPVAAAPPVEPASVPASVTPRVHATPVARRLAHELGIELATLHGAGPGGVITRADVERAAATRTLAGQGAASQPLPQPQPQAAPVAPAPSDRLAGMRRAIAAAMARSKREIPHYYLSARIDLSRALEWLATENARRPVADRLLPAALLLRAVALAAGEVPEVNGTFADGAFHAADAVHLGVAISLRGGGLVAPALQDAGQKDVTTLMRELSDLVRRTRAGVLRSSELGTATLTVTNLGDLGVDSVFGVIHPPQVAIVGFGRIAEQPWAREGLLGVHPIVVATLAADHRVSDGHRGARFLAAIDRHLQHPETL
jgi:pyruvate dehydrogenase E2 component (dihydrolipoamide acetyltransferase)